MTKKLFKLKNILADINHMVFKLHNLQYEHAHSGPAHSLIIDLNTL